MAPKCGMSLGVAHEHVHRIAKAGPLIRIDAGLCTPRSGAHSSLAMRIAIRLVVSVLVLATLMVWGAGEMLSRPASRAVGPPPADLGAESIRLPVSASDTVSGWFARGQGRGAVLLLHGLRSDRRQMLARARFLQAAGYAVLLIDLPAHGESTGGRIGFGLREAAGVRAALAYLRAQLPGQRVGAIGVSLGAAALVFSRPAPSVDAVILESLYPTMAEAVSNRLHLRFGSPGRLLAPLLLWQLPLRLGVSADDLRPVMAMPALSAPVLVAAGTDDLHTTWPETERVFAAAREPKVLWAVQGAAHGDLHAFSPDAYRERVLAFLSRHLRGPD